MKEIAEQFISQAICEWGQSEEKRIAAVQSVLDAAGFKAKATCWPIFGGIWREVCEGEEGEKATEWLKELTGTMPRGKFEWERDHVIEFIQSANLKK